MSSSVSVGGWASDHRETTSSSSQAGDVVDRSASLACGEDHRRTCVRSPKSAAGRGARCGCGRVTQPRGLPPEDALTTGCRGLLARAAGLGTLSPGVAGLLPACSVPTLVFWGRRVRPCPSAPVSRRLLAAPWVLETRTGASEAFEFRDER